jgi:hypothetical protein
MYTLHVAEEVHQWLHDTFVDRLCCVEWDRVAKIPRGNGSVQMVRASSVNAVAIRRWARASRPSS